MSKKVTKKKNNITKKVTAKRNTKGSKVHNTSSDYNHYRVIRPKVQFNTGFEFDSWLSNVLNEQADDGYFLTDSTLLCYCSQGCLIFKRRVFDF